MSDTSAFLQELSEHLFWDVDRDSVDVEAHARFLITRIMERGTREDVRAAWSFYGPDRVREELTQAPSLSKKTISFFANQFSIPKEAFRANGRNVNWSR
ncbi:MAG TPA: hypothetical protein VJ952_05465 [Opitutales bacterium]|nr:hypothetical protein [Opitutales bacterium]